MNKVLCFTFFSMTISLLSSSSRSYTSMAVFMLFLGFLGSILTVTDGQGIGVCYGKVANDLPPPADVVALYKQHNIGKMRIYEPDQEVLGALRGSNIELILGIANSALPALAQDPAAAAQWVQANVASYFPDVKIKYIAVGNEINPGTGSAQFCPVLVPAMKNIFDALAAAGLQGQIKVSTAIDMGLLGASYPPSTGAFNPDYMGMITPLIQFLSSNNQPLLLNLYTYFAYTGDNTIELPYAIFTNPTTKFSDSGLQYQHLFDAMLNGVHAALEKANGGNLEIVISESGWPSAGGKGATIENAQTYNQKLIDHVKTGTPKKPGKAIETYLFAMFNENLKPGLDTEKNFGLFFPSKQPVYPITIG